jgi:hypothetical protein
MRFKYLKHIELPYYEGDIIWTICPITGSLLKTKMQGAEPRKNNIPLKVSKAIEYCNQPYLCNPNNDVKHQPSEQKLVSKVNKMHEFLLKIGNSRFYLIRLYSSFKDEFFKRTDEAIFQINSLEKQIELKHQLCLQRAFLASKISKSFEANGVIFIGAFLPTGDMHAWIIENGIQPDSDDRGWINYRPLLALYN